MNGRQKRHECTNMGKLKRLELWWQLYVTWLPVRDLENFRPLDFCWTEGTKDFLCGIAFFHPHVHSAFEKHTSSREHSFLRPFVRMLVPLFDVISFYMAVFHCTTDVFLMKTFFKIRKSCNILWCLSKKPYNFGGKALWNCVVISDGPWCN